jgi:hypothetical protein
MTFPSGRLTDGTWLVANDAERDAIGSDDGLQADQRCFNLTNKRHESCVSVDGAAASTWSGIVKFAEVKTHADPSNDPDTQVAWYSIGQQITTTNGNTDTTVFIVDSSIDALYRFEFSITAFLNGNAGQFDCETWILLVDVTGGTPAITATEQSSDEKGAPAFEISDFVLSGNNVQVRISDTSSQTVNLMGDFKGQRMKESITP